MSEESGIRVTIDAEGYFMRGGRRIVPAGVNYWPASCGVEMWRRWDEEEIRRDLDTVAGLGLNCVRFFLRWPDFMPSLGVFDDAMFGRLAAFAGWCRERGILAHPCMVVGFMSGGLFWPAGKGSRNLYSDPEVRAASAAFCARAAATLRPFADTVLALDLGNELDCADCGGTPPEDIALWCREVTGAIRREWPDALVVSGLDSGPVMRDCPWHLDDQPGTDFLSVHNYPVPDWNVVDFDGMTDPFCQAILPFNTLVARSYGPVMVQEFSSIVNQGAPECESYNLPVVRDCFRNGANGFLWWCLRDIRSNAHPYPKAAFERRLGLVGEDGRPKPSLARLAALLRDIAEGRVLPGRAGAAADAPDGAAIGLYWPREIYSAGNPANPGNNLSEVYRRLLAAYYMAGRLGRRAEIVRGGMPLDPAPRTMVVAGAALTVPETEALEAWVAAGGRLLWSGADWHGWSEACDAMAGATPVDMKPARDIRVGLFGREWEIASAPACGTRCVARATTARVAAVSDDGLPAVFVNDHGAGRCVTVAASPEATVARLGADRERRDSWQAWFAGVLAILEGTRGP